MYLDWHQLFNLHNFDYFRFSISPCKGRYVLLIDVYICVLMCTHMCVLRLFHVVQASILHVVQASILLLPPQVLGLRSAPLYLAQGLILKATLW